MKNEEKIQKILEARKELELTKNFYNAICFEIESGGKSEHTQPFIGKQTKYYFCNLYTHKKNEYLEIPKHVRFELGARLQLLIEGLEQNLSELLNN